MSFGNYQLSCGPVEKRHFAPACWASGRGASARRRRRFTKDNCRVKHSLISELKGVKKLLSPYLRSHTSLLSKRKKSMSLTNVTSLNFDTFLNALRHTTNQDVKNIKRDVCPSCFHIFYKSFPVCHVR